MAAINYPVTNGVYSDAVLAKQHALGEPQAPVPGANQPNPALARQWVAMHPDDVRPSTALQKYLK